MDVRTQEVIPTVEHTVREATFPSVIERGRYIKVLHGNIELNAGFLDEGGDARASLDSGGCAFKESRLLSWPSRKFPWVRSAALLSGCILTR